MLPSTIVACTARFTRIKAKDAAVAHFYHDLHLLMCARDTGREKMTVKYREAANTGEKTLTHTDWWMAGKGIGNFGPVAVCLPLSIWFGWHSVTGSWQRSWVTPPPPSLEVRMEGTGTCTHSKHTHAQTQHPSPKLNSLFTSIISPWNHWQWNLNWRRAGVNPFFGE